MTGLKEASQHQLKARAVIVCENEYVIHSKSAGVHYLVKKNALEEILDTSAQKQLILN